MADKEVKEAIEIVEDEKIKKLKEELARYQRSYHIFMNYWEEFPDDVKCELDEDLKAVDL